MDKFPPEELTLVKIGMRVLISLADKAADLVLFVVLALLFLWFGAKSEERHANMVAKIEEDQTSRVSGYVAQMTDMTNAWRECSRDSTAAIREMTKAFGQGTTVLERVSRQLDRVENH